MLKLNKLQRPKFPKLNPNPYPPAPNQQNHRRETQSIMNCKFAQAPQTIYILNSQCKSYSLTDKKNRQSSSSKSTLFLQFPIGKNVRKYENTNSIDSPTQQSGNVSSAQKRALMPSNTISRQTKRKPVNSSALNITSMNKTNTDSESENIFMNRKKNLLYRKDVRTRMIKYMKNVQFRNNHKRVGSDWAEKGREGSYNTLSRSRMDNIERLRLSREKLEGWTNKNWKYGEADESCRLLEQTICR